jgi:hypothetical protein
LCFGCVLDVEGKERGRREKKRGSGLGGVCDSERKRWRKMKRREGKQGKERQ